MLLTFLGIKIDVNPELLNADLPIDLTLSGIVMKDNLEHCPKVLSSIEVMLLDRLTDVKLEHQKNAHVPMDLTLLGIFMDPNIKLFLKAP